MAALEGTSMAGGGSIYSVSIKNRSFTVAADADANRDLGGFTAEVQMNGDGTVRYVLTAKPWMVDGLTIEIEDDNDDQAFIQNIIDAGKAVPITMTDVFKNTYSGAGLVTGDLKKSTMSGLVPVTFSGGGKLDKQ